MNKKVRVMVIILFIALIGIIGYVLLVKRSSNFSAPVLFSLNDGKAKYYIAADNNFPEKTYLVYAKSQIGKRVMIVNGEKYRKNIGDQVMVTGKFVEVTYTVYCVRAPCPPAKDTRLEIDNLQVIKVADNSFLINNNDYQDGIVSFKFPDGFSHNKVCNPQDNHCTVNFEPSYNPYGKTFSFTTYPLKNNDGGSRNIDWFWNPEFKIISSQTMIKTSTQWAVMDVQINYTGLVATYYRIIHGAYLYEFSLIRNKVKISDANAIKIVEGTLDTFSFSGE